LNCTSSGVAASAVKGVWRTFILTLDRDRRHGTLEMGTKRNPFLFSFVPYWKKHRWNKHRFLASLLTTAETGRFDPRCRASIRTLNGPLWARCMLGSDFTPRSVTEWRTWVVRVLPSNRRSPWISRQFAVTRTRRWMSLPTEAGESLSCTINNGFEFRRLRCSRLGHWRERHVAQRLIHLSADPEPMQ
jgi:hypothetical protein